LLHIGIALVIYFLVSQTQQVEWASLNAKAAALTPLGIYCDGSSYLAHILYSVVFSVDAYDYTNCKL
jgi:hypothetical protein